MSWLQILILGVAVGFGEIFPLSGPGVSAPVRQLLGLPLDGSGDRMYSALLRMAVWLAVCLVLRRELWACLRSFSSPPRRRGAGIQEEARLHRRLALLLLLGTLPMIPALLLQTRPPAGGRSPVWRCFGAERPSALPHRPGGPWKAGRPVCDSSRFAVHGTGPGTFGRTRPVPHGTHHGRRDFAGPEPGIFLEIFLSDGGSCHAASIGGGALGRTEKRRFILCALSGWNGLGRVVRLPVPAAFAVCGSPGGLR